MYQECLELELVARDIPFIANKELQLTYKSKTLQKSYRPDLICYEKIIVELKSVKEIQPEHKAQLFNYLKATKMKLGLLVNFGAHPKVEIVRLVL